MKNKIKIMAVMLIIAAGLMKCKKDDVIPYTSPKNMIKGSWEVSSFVLNGIDHKDHYKGYVFEFKSNDIVIASKGGKNISGKWTKKESSILLDFGPEEPLSLLNNSKWDITENSIYSLVLKGGTGTEGTALLKFLKIK